MTPYTTSKGQREGGVSPPIFSPPTSLTGLLMGLVIKREVNSLGLCQKSPPSAVALSLLLPTSSVHLSRFASPFHPT